MTASNPITIHGLEYAYHSINLAITGRYLPDGTPDASFVLYLVPTRLDGETVQTAESAATCLLRGSFREVIDPAEQAAIVAIQTALQTLIIAKGL